MARGRMINSKIALNKSINQLSDDTSRLAFTWLAGITATSERIQANPYIVCARLFPRRSDVSPEKMREYIHEWVQFGLVEIAFANGEYWLEINKAQEFFGSGDVRPQTAVAAWRTEVMARDNYTCQLCGERGKRLSAHHVKPWITHPERRFDTSNGITLCAKCHREQHRCGWLGNARRNG